MSRNRSIALFSASLLSLNISSSAAGQVPDAATTPEPVNPMTIPHAAGNGQGFVKAPDPLFRNDETLNVTISAPFTTLVRERPKEDYLPGTFRITDADGTELELDLEIRTRGHFRHKRCDYPPLLLNFRKKQTDGTLFDKQNKLKLVVHCDSPGRYEQAVLREYVAYRLLNAVTDMSFRVRLLRVAYLNTEKDRKPQERYAFLIEHKNRLAERLDLNDLELERTSVSRIRGDQLNLTSVFEFMIGNTDFSPIAGPPDDQCCHNYVLFGNGTDRIVAVPYDFDQSGFVDAPYAAPDKRFKIRSVRQRVYRGRCQNNEHLEPSLQQFRDKRTEIRSLVEQQEGLTKRDRRAMINYIDEFYDLINDPRHVERKMISRCVGKP